MFVRVHAWAQPTWTQRIYGAARGAAPTHTSQVYKVSQACRRVNTQGKDVSRHGRQATGDGECTWATSYLHGMQSGAVIDPSASTGPGRGLQQEARFKLAKPLALVACKLVYCVRSRVQKMEDDEGVGGFICERARGARPVVMQPARSLPSFIHAAPHRARESPRARHRVSQPQRTASPCHAYIRAPGLSAADMPTTEPAATTRAGVHAGTARGSNRITT